MLAMAGFTEDSAAQRFFTEEVMRASDPYVPMDTGVLKNIAKNCGDEILYNTPYARYQWYGKLMVDPYTGKGAFFSEDYGFWSRPGVQKVLSDRDLNYQGAPRRGAFWVNRAWADNKYSIIKSTREFIQRSL